jgi:hypothetical protein
MIEQEYCGAEDGQQIYTEYFADYEYGCELGPALSFAETIL